MFPFVKTTRISQSIQNIREEAVEISVEINSLIELRMFRLWFHITRFSEFVCITFIGVNRRIGFLSKSIDYVTPYTSDQHFLKMIL